MASKPPVIVTSHYRPKRAAHKRTAQPAIPNRIVTIPSKRARMPAERPEAEPAPAVAERPRIVTARKPNRFGPVPDISAEEHRRRGDAAEALFREIVRSAR
jgi:hypothetical protein